MGRGQWGEGITGTTIKDTWTKSRGRVEAPSKKEKGLIAMDSSMVIAGVGGKEYKWVKK